MAPGLGSMNLPNALSLARLVSVVPLAALLWVGADPAYGLADVLALLLFGLTFATDLVDGWLARRRGQVTSMGALLDPLADKAIIACCLVFLTERGVAPAWAVVSILVREMAVTGLRGMAGSRGVIISASVAAKGKTALQSLAVLLLLVPPPLALPVLGQPAGMWILYAAVVATLYSGAQYFYAFFRGGTAASSASAATTGPATR